MKATLNLMSQLTTQDLMITSLEDLAIEYRKDLNPQLLAAAFCKSYGLIMNISGRFFGLTSEDIASYALEKLDQCLIGYEPGKYAFNTYFTKVLSNRFREATEALSTHKRKAMLTRVSFDLLVEQGFDLADDHGRSIDQVLDELSVYDLTDREMLYCKMVMQSYSNPEIAKEIGLSVTAIMRVRNRLRQKISKTALQTA